MSEQADRDALGLFLKFADDMKAIYHQAERPALAAVCPCGGSFEVSRHVTPAERRRAHVEFYSAHRGCPRRAREASDE